MKCDLPVNDTKHCNLLHDDTVLSLNILQLSKEKLKVNNVLKDSNSIFQNALTRLLIIIKMTYFQIELENLKMLSYTQ